MKAEQHTTVKRAKPYPPGYMPQVGEFWIKTSTAPSGRSPNRIVRISAIVHDEHGKSLGVQVFAVRAGTDKNTMRNTFLARQSLLANYKPVPVVRPSYVAEYFDVHPNTVAQWLERGTLDSFTYDGGVYVPRAALDTAAKQLIGVAVKQQAEQATEHTEPPAPAAGQQLGLGPVEPVELTEASAMLIARGVYSRLVLNPDAMARLADCIAERVVDALTATGFVDLVARAARAALETATHPENAEPARGEL